MKRIDEPLYQKLIADFRYTRGSYRKVAELNDLTFAQVWKVWTHGSKKYPWMKPIKEVLDEEDKAVRAELALRPTPKPEDIRKIADQLVSPSGRIEVPTKADLAASDAFTARTQEALMVRGTREQALVMLQRMHKVHAALTPLVASLVKRITAMNDLDVEATLNLLGKVGILSKQAVDMANAAVELERTVIGIPEDNTTETERPMSREEAMTILLGVGQTIKQAMESSTVDAEVVENG